jgi:hypothetical protein
MTHTSLGRVNVSASGSPVSLSTNPAQTVAQSFSQVIPGLTGKTVLGLHPVVASSRTPFPESEFSLQTRKSVQLGVKWLKIPRRSVL